MLVSLHRRGVTPSLFFFVTSTFGFSGACIKDASPQLRLTLFATPWAGGRVIGKNELAQGAGINHIGQETRRMKAIISRSAIIATSLLTGLIVFSATPSIADSPLSQVQLRKVENQSTAVEAKANPEEPKPLVAASPYVATAYSLRGRTASGRMVSRGLIAADPSVLPLGSRVRLDHPGYSGEYLVADTGGAIRGRRIDIWTPSTREAMRFGRRTVKLTVLSYGARKPRRSDKR